MTTASHRARPAGRRRRRWLSLLAVPALAALGVPAIARHPAAPAAGQQTRLDTAAAPAGGSGLPARVLMGYWQDFTNGATPLTLAVGSGYVDPSVVNDALDCLAARSNCGSFTPAASYPDIRGVMTWSINWDASNGYDFANTVAPHLAALP